MASVYEFEEHRAFTSAAKLYRLLNINLRLSPIFLKRNLRSRHHRPTSRAALAAIIDTLTQKAQVIFKLQGLAVESRFRCLLVPLDDTPVELQAVHSLPLALCSCWSMVQLQLREQGTDDLYALSDWLTMADELKGLRGTLWLRVLEGSSSVAVAWHKSPVKPTVCPKAYRGRSRRKGINAKRSSKGRQSQLSQPAQRADKGLQHTPLAPLRSPHKRPTRT